jgi:predicted permease
MGRVLSRPQAATEGLVMESLKSDLRFASRMLVKNPVLNGIAILSLALGIGANVAIFSLVSFLFLRALPHVEKPEQLVKVFNRTRFTDYGAISYLDYRDYRDANRVFTQLMAYGDEPTNLDLKGTPERVRTEMVSGNYFPALGVKPALGRLVSPDDDRPAAAVAVLSYDLWQRAFGSDPAVLGSIVHLNGSSLQVVGVAPSRFRGLELEKKAEIWIPISLARLVYSQGPPPLEQRGLGLWRVVGRLRPGVRIEPASANLTAIAQQLNQQYGGRPRRSPLLVTAAAAAFSPADRGAVTRLAGLLMAVVSLVLLIACVNIANLMLARTSQRRRELAMRQALGAGRRRLVRQLLTESLLLALLGGAAGVGLAYAMLPSLARFQLPAELVLDLELDHRLLGFALVLTLVTGLLVGLVPALRASRPDLAGAVKDAPASGKRKGLGMRGLFVVAQVALSLVLLVGAGLFLKSLIRLQAVDTGMEARNLATAAVDLRPAGYTDERGRIFYRQLLDRVAHLPDVQAASLSSALPLQADFASVVFFFDERPDLAEGTQIHVNLVAPDYFRTLGLRLLKGRDFTAADTGAASVCIVNQTLAERFWPGQDAIGKRLRYSSPTGARLEVIGVARNSKYTSLREESKPFVYLPYLQVYELFATTKHLLVRTSDDPAHLFAAIRREVKALDGALPLFDTQTMAGHLAVFLAQERQTTALLVLLAGLALLLAAIGLYGVMSYSVSQRTREVGIRMAMGAARVDVLRQMIGESARLILAGGLTGLVSALFVTRLVGSLLFGVSPTDAATFMLAIAVLAAVGMAAGFFPARRAARVDPMTAIRND